MYSYRSFGGSGVYSSRIKRVRIVEYHVWTVELPKKGIESTPVPVVSDAPTIIAFSSKVTKGIKRNIVLRKDTITLKKSFWIYRAIWKKFIKSYKNCNHWVMSNLCWQLLGEFIMYYKTHLTGYWFKNILNCWALIRKSVSLNSYGMFQPRGPNFRLSWTNAWKNDSP